MAHQVTGIEAYPDLVKRFDVQLSRLLAKDDCGGCKVRELTDVFKKLVDQRQKRDNDFRRR